METWRPSLSALSLSSGQVIAQEPDTTPGGERKASEGLRDGKSFLLLVASSDFFKDNKGDTRTPVCSH